MVDFKWCENLDEDITRSLSNLLNESINDEGMLGFDVSNQTQIDEYIFDLNKEIKKSTSHLLGGFSKNDELVAMLVLKTNSVPTHKHIAEITKTLISKDFRGSKGGGILFKGFSEILNFSKKEGISLLKFDVREGSRAEKIWRKLGFIVYGKLEKYSKYKGEYYSGIYMYGEVSNFKVTEE